MAFMKIELAHNENVDWNTATHVRLLTETGDDDAGQKILNHIKRRATDRVASVSSLFASFPHVRTYPDKLKGMRQDLRQMANKRSSGEDSRNKGKIELGYLTTEEQASE